MKKISTVSSLSALSMFISMASFPWVAHAEDISGSAGCAEWKSSVAIDTKSLEKLEKNSAKDKPEKGASYTQDQFVVMLGKDPGAAREVLATSKDKLPKTSEGKVDLKDAELNGFNLSGLNLDNVDFKGAELNGANLSGSTLRGASLYKAELKEANLNQADLSYANVSSAELTSASMCGAKLASANMEDAEITGAYLKGANLDMAKHIPKIIYQNSESVLRLGLPVPPRD